MTWLNLTPVEFGVLFAMAAGLAVWMYLMHQRPRRTIVSTLRFWQSVEQAPVARRRRKVQEPWALLAQLMFLFLVLLALANPRRNGFAATDGSVLLMVDGSVWTQVQPDGQPPWIDQVRARAIRYLNSLPAGEQVGLMRTDGDGIPVVPFTSDHEAVRQALKGMRATDMAADLPRSLELGDSALAGRFGATLVYIGPGMADDAQLARLASFRKELGQRDPKSRPRLVVQLVGRRDSIDDRGITRLALRRDSEHPERWRLLAQVRNYAPHPARVHVRVSLDGRPLDMKPVYVAAHGTGSAEASFDDRQGGVLAAHIDEGDALAADNDAVAYLPAFRPAHVAVYTADAAVLKRVLSADPFVQVEFLRPGAAPASPPDVTIYDGVALPAVPPRNAIIFVPGHDTRELRLTSWNAQHPVTRWIRTRDISVKAAVRLQQAPGDVVLAWGGREPLAVAREHDGEKQVLIGFDPRQSNFPLQPAFPLLMAASIEWMTGAVAENSDPPAAGEVEVPGAATRVSYADGRAAPFAVADGKTHLIAARAGLYRTESPAGSGAIAVNVPPLPGQRWNIDGGDDGSGGATPAPPRYFWSIFVLLALVPLWAEWMFYYTRERRLTADVIAPQTGGRRRVA